jgi:hypothetical protein
VKCAVDVCVAEGTEPITLKAMIYDREMTFEMEMCKPHVQQMQAPLMDHLTMRTSVPHDVTLRIGPEHYDRWSMILGHGVVVE